MKQPFPLLRGPVLFTVLLSVLSASCGSRAPSTGSPESPQVETSATAAAHPVATVRPGSSPLWFELGPEGPRTVTAPGSSALVPFAPWPLARRSSGFVVREGLVTLGANRDGFVVFAPQKAGTVSIYRLSDPGSFGTYSIASVFSFRGQPTALLYRDHFFVDPSAPAPEPRSFSVSPGSPAPVPVSLPTLAAFPSAEGWDVEALDRSSDGRWLFRAVRRSAEGGASGEPSYLSAAGLDAEATPTSAGAYRGALLPRPSAEAEAVLRRVLDALATTLGPRTLMVVSAVGPGAASVESYLVSASPTRNVETALSRPDADVQRAWACSDGARAYLVTSPGETYTALGREGAVVRSHLPALPEGFAYTGIGATRNLAVITWEEQDGWAVGSAGFLVLSAGALVGEDDDGVL